MSEVTDLKEKGVWDDVKTRQAGYGLVKLINDIGRDVIGIEIGVCAGLNSYVLLESCPNIKKLYGVDSWAPFEDWNGPVTQELQDLAYAATIATLKPFENRIKLIRSTSTEAANYFRDESMDFVFIDGDHSHEGVLNDLTLYYPKVKKGGIISGHDFSFPSVGGAIGSFIHNSKITNPKIGRIATNAWYWIKE